GWRQAPGPAYVAPPHPTPLAMPEEAWGEGTGGRVMSKDHLSLAARSKKFGAAEGEGIVRCDACPVLCRIRPGRAGACARYANENGQLVRTDPVLLTQRTLDQGGKITSFAGSEWDGAPLDPSRTFVTGVGAGTTY